MAQTRRSVGLADLPYRAPYGRLAAGAGAGDTATLPLAETMASRAVEIAALRPDGTPERRHIRIPDHPAFTAAFAAFGRGTLIATPQGETAVEDLVPGDAVLTGAGRASVVQWIGSASFAPPEDGAALLFRVMEGSFGLARPQACVTLGHAARLRQAPDGLLMPIGQLADGEAVIGARPQAPVELFHLWLGRHATLRASGLDCESFHPGQTALRSLPRSLRRAFVEMFPGIAEAEDFGPLACARAPDEGEEA